MHSPAASLVLIVDDNTKNLQLLGEILRNEGFRVGVAINGELALAAVETVTPDLILMDVTMPVMDGFEACKRLQANSQTRHIPVIFLTARVENEDIKKGFMVGGVDYVAKPFQKVELLARVNAHIRLEKMSQAQAKFNQQLKQQNSELTLANNQLKALKQQAIESAKMVSLGNMLVWMAHEINTPLGISMTSASYQEKVIEDMRLSVDKERQEKAGLLKNLDQLLESSDIITAALRQVASIIDDCKQLSTNKTQRNRESFGLKDNLKILPQYFKEDLAQASHQLSMQCPAELSLNSYPDVFFQVFCILIENSLNHGYQGQQGGNLSINVRQQEQDIVIEYSDDGEGVSNEHLDKIFEPFFTTKRHEGKVGLGLSILYNLVKQVLDGEVHCVSEQGQKTSFVMKLPVSHTL